MNDAAYKNATDYFSDVNMVMAPSTETETASPTEAPTADPVTELPVVEPTSVTETTLQTEEEPPIQPVGKKGESGSLFTIVVVVIAVLAALVAILGRKAGKKSHEEKGQVTLPFDNEDSLDSIYKFGYAETVGARPVQEDAMGGENTTSTKVLVERGVLAMVADGAGMEKSGEHASHAAISAVGNGFNSIASGMKPDDCLLELCARAQNELCAYKEKTGIQLGCSLLTVLIRAGEVYFLSVGDCRLYLYRSNALLQLNREHVCYTDTGAISPSGSMHSDGISGRSKDVTAYIGKDNLNRLDRNINAFNMMPGDRLLLMTDGVYDALSEEEMLACMKDDAQQAAQSIIHAVSKKQLPGQDNATVLVIAR